jgi:putative membrane protein
MVFMKHMLVASALALSLCGSTAWAAPASPRAALFAQGAALGNQFEIEESKIILEDSANPALRAFARQMIHDHSMAQTMLDEAGASAEVPTRFVFDKNRQKSVDDLGLMDGPKLDRAYVADQIQAHAQAAALLSDYAMNGEDPALRAWARQTLPHVLMHQRILSEITGTMPGI